jgi:hypothetical protein
LEDAELHAANVVGVRSGLLGEELDPTSVAPVQNDKAALREAFFEAIGDVVTNVIELFIRREHHRDLQGGDSRVDAAEARARKRDGLELLDAELLDHFGLVALLAAGIDFQLDFSARGLLPLLAHVQKDFVPARALGNQSAEANDGLGGEREGENQAEESCAHHQKNGNARRSHECERGTRECVRYRWGCVATCISKLTGGL